MKKFCFFLLWAGSICLHAQPNITRLEYFIDADPGRGNGTSINLSSPTINILENVNISSLSLGFHVFTVRAEDANGVWGIVESKPFFISLSTTASQNDIINMEYFIDADPGRGAGVDIPITPSLSLDILENVPTSTLSEGFHLITVRAQDDRGNWGLSESKPFYVNQSTGVIQNNIVAMEYFIDADPGRGSGVDIPITPSLSLDISENVPTLSLSEGFHVFTVRAQDERGVWGLSESKPFVVLPTQSTNLVALEYFIDADPGIGSGTSMPISPSPNINISDNISTSSLSDGFHTFSIRAQDDRGIWGELESKPFFVSQSSTVIQNNITALEYFIDADPGRGSGVDIPITPSLSFDILENVPTSSLSEGFHLITVRAKDEQNVWGLSESKPFYVNQSTTAIQNDLVSLEYYFDTDPGYGNGIPITVSPSVNINMLENIPIGILSDGFHRIFIRAKDINNEWSLTESKSFFIDEQRLITNYEYAIDTDPGVGLAIQQPITPPQNLIDETLLIDTSPLAIGNHNLFIRIEDSNFFWSKTSVVPFNVCDGGLPNFVADAACLGSVTTFTDMSTNILPGDIYSWDFDGDLIEDDNTFGSTTFTYLTAGSFTARLTIDRSGCIGSFTLNVDVVNPPQAPSGQDATICEGEATTLTVSGGTNGQYRWYTEATGNTLATTSTSDTFTTPSLTSSTSYFVAINDGTCESTRTQVDVIVSGVCNNPPVIGTVVISVAVSGSTTIDLLPFLSDPDNNLDLTSLKITVEPASGAVASINGSLLFIDYANLNFVGTDFMTIEICDLSLACTQQQLEIEVSGNIIVHNAISPNGDGLNDFWTIQNINNLEPENRVRLYTRWGDKIFDMENYDNTNRRFNGIGTGGKKLSSGVYFYKIEFVSGREALTGFLSIKK